MNPQEQQMLDDFLARLAAVHGVAKDPQVDALIQQRLATQADAQYLLVQRALLLERALEHAHQQIAQLQEQVAGAAARDPGGASFLQRGLEPGFGRHPTAPGLVPQPEMQAPPQPPAQAAGWRERWFGGAPSSAAPQQAAPAGSGSSFLGTAAASAAGVAGGMFLFNGLGHLLGAPHGSSSFFGGATPAQGQGVTENLTQNFYDNSGRASANNEPLLSGANEHVWDDMTSGIDDGFLDNDLTT
ncbi:DUF2076 domain-containing protein [Variovorax sp. HJSM1_2]|uniref:DUF2076 domain-containing protein n=1 Tax=Variovorax sp. HJSM1_2 TaxID=3366263 RepID=UPI003BC0E863